MKIELFSTPHVLSLSLANCCSAYCVWCPIGRGEYRRRSNRFLPVEVVDKLIRDCRELPIEEVWFSENGEGLLNPNFVEIVSKCRVAFPEAGFAVATNLHALTEEKSKFILSNNFVWLGCNIDGYSQEAYGAVKGLPVENAKKNLLRFIALRNETKSKCGVHLDILTQPQYYQQIGEPRKITVKDEALMVFVWARMHLDWGQMDWVMLPFALTWAERERWNRLRTEDDGWCLAMPTLGRKFFVDTDGNNYNCCADFNSDYINGNVLEKSVLDIWRGGLRESFITNLLNRNYEAIGFPCSICHD